MLLDGSPEGRLLPHLIDRLGDPNLDRIAMAVSFVMKSGLAHVLQPLEDALDRGAYVRILTTDYLAITDPDALTQLADLAEGRGGQLEVRLFDGRSVAFHPKAYIFWSSAGVAAAWLIARAAGYDARMRDSETTASADGGEGNAPTRRPRGETARLGKEIYERDIRHLVETDHQGEVVAIDVDSGSYALGKNAIVASEGLRDRYPGAQVWLMRVGHQALYRFGGSSLRRAG